MGERRGTKALELWCRRMTEGYKNVKIDNMTTSWRNGLAFCAMIHHFRPDLIEFEKLDKNNVYFNNDLAFRTAEQYLGIPALLDADDMATYEVPDRLSILTYLSQYYQVFASQDSPNRLKRTSTSAGESTITKTTATPPKMAHIVGVPKREPCQNCSLPVFLAERLIVGKLVYHRTCLKCARCQAQLTLGSFYETEIDGEFCCETCPDEEKTPNPIGEDTTSTTTVADSTTVGVGDNTNRNSIAGRLAFFETNSDGKKFLLKSMSDEEKSQSLKRITEFKPSTALNNFMASTLKDDHEDDNNDNSEDASEDESGNDDGDDDDDVQFGPPKLPTTLPPNQLYDETISEKTETQIELQNDSSNEDATPAPPTTPAPLTTLTTPTTSNDLNVNLNITKDNSSKSNKKDANVQMRHKNEISIELKADDQNNDNQLERLSMVRARLQQFEGKTSRTEEKMKNFNLKKLENENENEHKISSIISKTEDDNDVHKNNSSIVSFETETKEEINKIELTNKDEKIVDEEKVPKFKESEEILTEDNNLKLIDSVSNLNTTATASNDQTNNDVEILRDEKEIKLSEDDEQVEDKTTTATTATEQLKLEIIKSGAEKLHSVENMNSDESVIAKSVPVSLNKNNEDYPVELNPFGSDDDDDEKIENDFKSKENSKDKRKSLNPFGSEDDGDDDGDHNVDNTKNNRKDSLESDKKIKPPRPPPPKISKNPFGNESDEDVEDENINKTNISSLSSNSSKRAPVPTPRTQILSSKTSTPEPTPRSNRQNYSLENSSDYYGSSASLNAANSSGPREYFQRHHDVRDSNSSLTSSTAGAASVGGSGSKTLKKIKKAPAPPPPTTATHVSKELFPSTSTSTSTTTTISDVGGGGDGSKKSTPSSSNSTTPHQPRKKRPAPKPPALSSSNTSTPVKHDEIDGVLPMEEASTSEISTSTVDNEQITTADDMTKSQIDKLSDEEKAAHFEGKKFFLVSEISEAKTSSEINETETLENDAVPRRKLIALDLSLVEDAKNSNDIKSNEEDDESLTYRRKIGIHDLMTPTKIISNMNDMIVGFPQNYDRQLEKLKDNKEAKNRNRQSQLSDDGNDPFLNKSIYGKWKRRKGPAPSLPIPPRKVLQMLPLQEIRHELEIIEVQQQGLEKQGVILETMIRERCEGKNGELNSIPIDSNIMNLPPVQNSKEVEDLILQLFELVNEKNELFRRQAELMYLRRQHRLEQEQANLEYEIRVSMAQPERNKTDTDKAREEALIARMVEVVQLRNDVIERLEMDRLREAEEDLSIKQRLELHTAKRDEEFCKQTPTKLSKKEKKKLKESKKLEKSKKLDADKDADESEFEPQKEKKKKKKFLF